MSDIVASPPQLRQPSRLLTEIEAVEASLIFRVFTADTAWDIGTRLRSLLLDFDIPTVVSISLANSDHLLFHCVTGSGTCPDNDSWIARKRATVLRWGHSSWWMHNKVDGDERKFATKYGLGN